MRARGVTATLRLAVAGRIALLERTARPPRAAFMPRAGEAAVSILCCCGGRVGVVAQGRITCDAGGAEWEEGEWGTCTSYELCETRKGPRPTSKPAAASRVQL